MSRMLLAVLVCLGVLGVGNKPTPAQAQVEPAPKPEDLELHPTDRIVWEPTSPHRVRFGGTVQVTPPGGATKDVTLTSFNEVNGLLKFNPPIDSSDEVLDTDPGDKLEATVNSGAVGSTFNFTCGAHPDQMISLPFKIVAPTGGAARDIHITTADQPRRWLLSINGGAKMNLNNPNP